MEVSEHGDGFSFSQCFRRGGGGGGGGLVSKGGQVPPPQRNRVIFRVFIN